MRFTCENCGKEINDYPEMLDFGRSYRISRNQYKFAFCSDECLLAFYYKVIEYAVSLTGGKYVRPSDTKEEKAERKKQQASLFDTVRPETTL